MEISSILPSHVIGGLIIEQLACFNMKVRNQMVFLSSGSCGILIAPIVLLLHVTREIEKRIELTSSLFLSSLGLAFENLNSKEVQCYFIRKLSWIMLELLP